MNTNTIFPNFLIGGPPKCASTSLYFYMKQHPEIFMSPTKQTRFFSEKYDKGIEFYLKNYFSGVTNQKMAGEATPGYFLFPFVVERIYGFNPGMKFIFCFRNPVERAFSGWNMRLNNGTENLSFINAMKANVKQRETEDFTTEPDTKDWKDTKDHNKFDSAGYRVYVEGSLYAFNLKQYYKYFKPEQIKIIFIDSLKNDFDNTIKSLFSFLGVDENYKIEHTEEQNTAKTGKGKSGKTLRKLKKLGGKFARFLPASFKKKMLDKMYNKSTAEGSKAKITDEERRVAYEIFKDDIAELEKMLNIDLSRWKV